MASALAWWYARPAARDWQCGVPSESARAFHAAFPGYQPTPLVDLPAVADELGVARVLVKDESARFDLAAFKVLGASWAIARVLARRGGLDRAGRPPQVTLDDLKEIASRHPVTLVTATDGNHGRAVARMAALLGAGAHVVVPGVISDQAADAIAAEGATVVRVDGNYDEAVRHAAAWALDRTDAELVQDVGWPGYNEVPGWIVEGYATLLIEVDDALVALGILRPNLVVVPVGVGSLAQAVVAHYRSRTPGGTSVLSVEPDTAACVLASLQAGEPRSIPTATTVMEGLNCGTPSHSAWPYLRDGLDAATVVSDAQAGKASNDLASLGVSSGPSGAATLAGARAALTGSGVASRRDELGIDEGSIVVLLSTEGRTHR